MTREKAINVLEDALSRAVFMDDIDVLEMAIYALREQESPCVACGYGGKHLDAPPCTTCPAHPKLESELRVFESNRIESDTVKGVDSNQFKTNADHIRSMTDEELYSVLEVLARNDVCVNSAHDDCATCVWYQFCGSVHCAEDVKDWLKQPYKDAT